MSGASPATGRWSRGASRAVYFSLYAVAYLAAAWLYVTVPIADPAWRAAAAGGAATIILYAAGLALRNSGTYDVYWSLTPVLVAVAWIVEHGTFREPRALAALFVTALWGLRLTYNWTSHFQTFDVEDWRYVDMRKKTGKAYPVASFFALYVFPFTLVGLGFIPLHAAISAGGALGALDVVGLLVGVGAVVLEAVSDVQLTRFRRTNTDPAKFMCTGLWATSRHPNYCGEMLYWWASALFGFAVSPSVFMFLAALGVTGMIVFASIPMAEERALAKRPAYADYQRRVSRLIPLPPKRA